MNHLVIIGNGISGITAARHVRKQSNCKITIISGETEHFFSRTALMYVFMGHMKYQHIKPYEDHFWKKNNLDLKRAWVESINTDEQALMLQNGERIAYDQLVIATGSKSNKFGWKGQDLKGVQGLYSWQDLELLEENVKECKTAIIIGGGLIGVELAEMLHTREVEVIMLVREKLFWGGVLPKEEAEMVSNHIQSRGIKIQFETELDEILEDGNGKVKAIKTKSGDLIDCQLVGLTVGVHPNTDVLKGSKIKTDKGVLVNEFLETNIPNVYSIGDCAEFHQHPTGRKNIEQVWYTGKMMGETVAQTLCGNRTAYRPGVWFNSAKFVDLEYQTYGWVWNEVKENEKMFFYQDLENDRMIKFIFDKNTEALLGINALGIRLRHRVCDKWISEKSKIDTVIQNLGAANFDPEIYKTYEEHLILKYNAQFNKNIQLKMKKSGMLANLFTKILN